MLTYYVSAASVFLIGAGVMFLQELDSDVKREYEVSGEAIALSHQHAMFRSYAALSSWSGISDELIDVAGGPFGNSEYATSMISVRMDSPGDTRPEVILYTWSLPSLHDGRNLRMGAEASRLQEKGTLIGVVGAEDGPFSEDDMPDMGGAVIPDGAVLAITTLRSGA